MNEKVKVRLSVPCIKFKVLEQDVEIEVSKDELHQLREYLAFGALDKSLIDKLIEAFSKDETKLDDWLFNDAASYATYEHKLIEE